MRLNNKGWGLTTLIMCLGIILFFLLISVFYAGSFKNKIDNEAEKNNEVDNNYYIELENKVDNAAVKYINENHIFINNGEMIVLKIEKFQELGYLENIVDYISNKPCNGYSTIKNENETYVVSSYISCDNYKTEGYSN